MRENISRLISAIRSLLIWNLLMQKRNMYIRHGGSLTIKDAEEKIAANKVIKTHIINYAKTRETYIAYRKSGYSKKFYEAHRDEITLHKAAKEAFSKLPDGKIPKVKDLNEEFTRLLSEKKSAYSEYKKIKKEMRDYQIAKQNVESFYAAQQSWDIEEDMKNKLQQAR